MTFVLTSFKAYGIESSEPLQKRFIQRMELDITGANTDTAYDFGTYGGTFWTAVGGTEPGTTALKAIKNIALIAKAYWAVGGLGLTGKTQIGTGIGAITTIDSAAGSGGAATATLTVTGLATTDTILAASQVTSGANHLAFIEWTDTARTVNALDVRWTGDPGSGSIIRVLVRKAAVAPVSGQYTVALDGTNTTLPNIAFVSGNAPTTAYIIIEWELKDNVIPIEA